MSQIIHLVSNQAPQHLRSVDGYSGNKYKAEIRESVTINGQAGIWDGGSRETYSVVRIADGKALEPVDRNAAPWDSSRKDVRVTLEPGIAVVRHSIFCGKDMGLTFYVTAGDAAPMLPAPCDLTDDERKYLEIVGTYISRARPDEFRRAGILAQVETLKAALIARGYLSSNGAITVKGRNARS